MARRCQYRSGAAAPQSTVGSLESPQETPVRTLPAPSGRPHESRRTSFSWERLCGKASEAAVSCLPKPLQSRRDEVVSCLLTEIKQAYDSAKTEIDREQILHNADRRLEAMIRQKALQFLEMDRRDALHQWWEQQGGRARALQSARRRGAGRDQAEDITQHAYLRVCQLYYLSGKMPGDIANQLDTLVRNLLMDQHRRRCSRELPMDAGDYAARIDAIAIQSGLPGVHEHVADAILEQRIREALDAYVLESPRRSRRAHSPRTERAVFLRRVLLNWKPAEVIAAHTGDTPLTNVQVINATVRVAKYIWKRLGMSTADRPLPDEIRRNRGQCEGMLY